MKTFHKIESFANRILSQNKNSMKERIVKYITMYLLERVHNLKNIFYILVHTYSNVVIMSLFVYTQNIPIQTNYFITLKPNSRISSLFHTDTF